MGRKESNQTKTSAAIVHWFNDVMEINTCNSLLDKKQLFSLFHKKMYFCVITFVQFAHIYR